MYPKWTAYEVLLLVGLSGKPPWSVGPRGGMRYEWGAPPARKNRKKNKKRRDLLLFCRVRVLRKTRGLANLALRATTSIFISLTLISQLHKHTRGVVGFGVVWGALRPAQVFCRVIHPGRKEWA